MEDKKSPMVSRSFRIGKDTLEALEEQAELQGLGITVYIRRVLESLVDNLNTIELVRSVSYGEDSLTYPEL